MYDINTTDETLITGIKKDDYVSYNKLFTHYYGRLCQYVYTLLENRLRNGSSIELCHRTTTLRKEPSERST